MVWLVLLVKQDHKFQAASRARSHAMKVSPYQDWRHSAKQEILIKDLPCAHQKIARLQAQLELICILIQVVLQARLYQVAQNVFMYAKLGILTQERHQVAWLELSLQEPTNAFQIIALSLE
jgi:hypothetical protein